MTLPWLLVTVYEISNGLMSGTSTMVTKLHANTRPKSCCTRTTADTGAQYKSVLVNSTVNGNGVPRAMDRPSPSPPRTATAAVRRAQ
jgi:hypothetical protein